MCALCLCFRHMTDMPIMTTTDGNQYSIMQGAIKVLSVKAFSPASLFVVEAHDERVRVKWPR